MSFLILCVNGETDYIYTRPFFIVYVVLFTEGFELWEIEFWKLWPLGFESFEVWITLAKRDLAFKLDMKIYGESKSLPITVNFE